MPKPHDYADLSKPILEYEALVARLVSAMPAACFAEEMSPRQQLNNYLRDAFKAFEEETGRPVFSGDGAHANEGRMLVDALRDEGSLAWEPYWAAPASFDYEPGKIDTPAGDSKASEAAYELAALMAHSPAVLAIGAKLSALSNHHLIQRTIEEWMVGTSDPSTAFTDLPNALESLVGSREAANRIIFAMAEQAEWAAGDCGSKEELSDYQLERRLNIKRRPPKLFQDSANLPLLANHPVYAGALPNPFQTVEEPDKARDIQRAISHYAESIAVDPKIAPEYIALAKVALQSESFPGHGDWQKEKEIIIREAATKEPLPPLFATPASIADGHEWRIVLQTPTLRQDKSLGHDAAHFTDEPIIVLQFREEGHTAWRNEEEWPGYDKSIVPGHGLPPHTKALYFKHLADIAESYDWPDKFGRPHPLMVQAKARPVGITEGDRVAREAIYIGSTVPAFGGQYRILVPQPNSAGEAPLPIVQKLDEEEGGWDHFLNLKDLNDHPDAPPAVIQAAQYEAPKVEAAWPFKEHEEPVQITSSQDIPEPTL